MRLSPRTLLVRRLLGDRPARDAPGRPCSDRLSFLLVPLDPPGGSFPPPVESCRSPLTRCPSPTARRLRPPDGTAGGLVRHLARPLTPQRSPPPLLLRANAAESISAAARRAAARLTAICLQVPQSTRAADVRTVTSLAVNCPIACDHCVLSVELQVRHFGLIFGPPDASADRGIRCQDSPHPLDSAVIFSCLFSRRIAFPTCRLVLPAREGASDHCDLRITTPSSIEYYHLSQCRPRSLHRRGLAF